MATAGDFGTGTRHAGFRAIKSAEGEFDYNQQIAVEDTQTQYREMYIRSNTGVANPQGPILFTLEPSRDWYIQLGLSRLEVTFHVVKGNGADLDRMEDVVAPVNLLGPCMFQSVEPTLNGHPMSGSSCVHAGIKAFIDTMLSYDNDAATSHMTSQFLHMDAPGHYDSFFLSLETLKDMFKQMLQAGDLQGLEYPENTNPLPPGARRPNGERYSAQGLENENNARLTRRRLFEKNQFYLHMNGTVDRVQAIAGAADHLRSGVNPGFETRCRLVSGSEKITMYSPIPHDIFNLNNHLGPMNRLDLKLIMYPARFLLNTYMQQKGYKIVIDDCKLHLRAIKRKESIPMPLKEVYRMNETNLFKQVVPRGLQTFTFRMLNTSVMPKTIILTMVSTAAIEGNYTMNPWNFHHYHVNRLSLTVNGEERPSGGLEFDFEKRVPNTARAYSHLFANTGALAGNRGNLVSLRHFQAGCFLVAFDLTPDQCNNAHEHQAELGYIDLNISWARELPTPITILYELVYTKVLVNDKTSGSVAVLDVAV